MPTFKCKMCGGSLTIEAGATVCECDYCGSKQTLPSADNEKKLKLFDRANRLRFNCEFDKAGSIYEDIINEFPEEAEAYWGNLLCKYGIEYVDDPATGDKVPTCHRSSFDSFMDEEDFELVMENSDMLARNVYREQAKQIEEIRKGIIEVSGKEQPYDIFICYKETDENNQRTLDSVLAQDVYDALTEKGYRVFFSRISLEDKLGTEYEPYIFAALNSAKVMLAFGTSYDYYNAVWVKNEWSRYLKLMAKDKSKHLIPCFKGIDAYDMPKEFAKLQAQDLGKVGATQDLLRGIDKLLGGGKQTQQTAPAAVNSQTIASTPVSSVEPLIKRVFMFLEDGNWKSANEYCEKVLDLDPENAQAYLGKLMASLNIKTKKQFSELDIPFSNNRLYNKLLRYADEDLKKYIQECNLSILYDHAVVKMNNAQNEKDYSDVAQEFQQLGQFKDAESLAMECIRLAMFKKKEFENTVNAVLVALQEEKKRKISVGSNKSIEEQLQYYQYQLSDLESFFDVFTELCEKIKTGELQIRQMENEKEHLEERYSTLGIFSGKEKRSITENIDSLNSNIRSIKESIREWEGQKRGYTSTDVIKKDIGEARKKILKIQDELAVKKNVKEKTLSLKEALEFMDADINVKKAVQERSFDIFLQVAVKKGSSFEFGKYQNAPIEWLVLECNGKKALLISKYIIEFKRYNTNREDWHSFIWEKCTLRTWLNEAFYKDAFTSTEHKKIIKTKVSADKNPNHNTDPGNATEDNIFLLSISEAEKYFVDNKSRKCLPTAYVSTKYGIKKSPCWWLRTPGDTQFNATCILNDGSVCFFGDCVYETNCGVRPALWINLDS